MHSRKAVKDLNLQPGFEIAVISVGNNGEKTSLFHQIDAPTLAPMTI
jgi:hypothetical protein